MAEYYKGWVKQAAPETIGLTWRTPHKTTGNDLRMSTLQEMDITLDTSRYHICVPIDGSETYRVAGQRYVIKPGQYFILNPGQEVRAEGKMPKAVNGFCLFLSMETLSEAAQDMELNSNQTISSPSREFILKNYHLEENAFGRHLQKLLPQLLYPDNMLMDWEVFYGDLAVQLLQTHCQISQQLKAIPYTGAATKEEIYKRISMVNNYILECYAQPISLDILEKVGLFSKYHVVRLYRLLYGMTPYQHVLQLRIEKAKSLLRKEFSPTEVAYMLSFSDRRAFSKVFKKWVGVAPGNYHP